LICLFAGLIMVVAGTLAFFTKSYRKLTVLYASAPDQDLTAERDDAGESDDAGEGDDVGQSDDAAEGDGTDHAAHPDHATHATHPDAPPPVRGLPPEIPEVRR
jgi:DHA3 family multidrug efflux protein-like MFS transporter